MYIYYVLMPKTNKRKDYMTWNVYFMKLAELTAERSKDPSTQVGACIVNDQNHIVGLGYNGFPKGCSDDEFPWSKHGEDNKYLYVIHAEINAINNKNMGDITGATMYVTHQPCNECAKSIIQSGIKKVIYLYSMEDNPRYHVSVRASKRMFRTAGVELAQYKAD